MSVGALEGEGVAARVTGVDNWRFERVVRKVPYLLPSPLVAETPDSPADGCEPIPGGRRNVEVVGSGDSTSSNDPTEL